VGELAGRLLRRSLLAAAWIAAGYYFLAGGEYGVLDVHEMASERDSLAARVDSLRQVADSLEGRAEMLESSDFAIEREARERYGFIRDGERLYRFVEVAGEGGDEGGTGLDRSRTNP
jgi:cell division protein FtsB